jgi:hypothetical protein
VRSIILYTQIEIAIQYMSYLDPIVPMYFYVPMDNIEEEKQEPGSQPRVMNPESSPCQVFLWGQAMYIIAQLLTSGLVHLNEIDLARRYMPAYNRPRRAMRYSAFQVAKYNYILIIDQFLKAVFVFFLRAQ